MSELRLSEIWIYPIKSLGGVRLAQADVLAKGLDSDRRYMLVDENHQFMTQRDFPILSQFKLSQASGKLEVRFKDQSLMVDRERLNKPHEALIWNDTISVNESDPRYHEWFSDILGFKCKLVSFPENNDRKVEQAFNRGNDQVSLADGYPFLIIGQSSLDLLNSKLVVPIPMNRFRPNFVFSGGEPHIEDTWNEFVIGANRFVGVKICARCAVPTINQETGEKGIEPTKTLASYRRVDNNIYFGMNLLPVDLGTVHEGDAIMIYSKRKPVQFN